MSSYDIALSGMRAAQAGFDVVGNNIANAATEGYHKQEVVLTPIVSGQASSTAAGQGVAVEQIVRKIDILMEQEILKQKANLAQVDRETVTLSTLESALGELSTEGSGLNAAIDSMFNALDDLSLHPWDAVYQNQLVSEADAMASQFRSLGETVAGLEENIQLEAVETISMVNALAEQVAEMNLQVMQVSTGGKQANNLIDQRDQVISEISKLIGVSVQYREHDVVDVNAGGIPLVMGGSARELEASSAQEQTLGISTVGSSVVNTNLQGGTIGALISLKNTIVKDLHTEMDTLANAIIQNMNEYHVQGVGSSGSFSDLTGRINSSDALADLTGVTAGYTYIRVTNTATGDVTRSRVPVLQDVASDTLTEVTQYITANVANLSASIGGSNQVYLSAAPGYTFDFLPEVLPEPASGDISFTGASDPAVSLGGVYTGTANDIFTFTVVGTGNVGVSDPLTLTVTDVGGDTVASLNIGNGYAAGDMLTIGETGVTVSLGIGDLVAGDDFSLDILADSDTSGLLATTGLNTFFEGSSAASIAIRSDIVNDMGRVASSSISGQADNSNAMRMASVRDKSIASLGDISCGQFYRRMVTNVGQDLSIKEVRLTNTEDILQNLTNQQSELSGVDINDEAARLLVFEQMFQAMAQYLTTVQTAMESLMTII
jgi:flagellar hook-associated protein 1 FlgK